MDADRTSSMSVLRVFGRGIAPLFSGKLTQFEVESSVHAHLYRVVVCFAHGPRVACNTLWQPKDFDVVGICVHIQVIQHSRMHAFQ